MRSASVNEMIRLLRAFPESINPNCKEYQALFMAADTRNHNLLRLILDHPQTLIPDNVIYYLTESVLDWDGVRMASEMLKSRQIPLDAFFHNRRIFGFKCRQLVRNLSQDLLEACTEAKFGQMNLSGISDAELDICFVRTRNHVNAQLVRQALLKSTGISKSHSYYDQFDSLIHSVLATHPHISSAHLRTMLKIRGTLYMLRHPIHEDVNDLIAVSVSPRTVVKEKPNLNLKSSLTILVLSFLWMSKWEMLTYLVFAIVAIKHMP